MKPTPRMKGSKSKLGAGTDKGQAIDLMRGPITYKHVRARGQEKRRGKLEHEQRGTVAEEEVKRDRRKRSGDSPLICSNCHAPM